MKSRFSETRNSAVRGGFKVIYQEIALELEVLELRYFRDVNYENVLGYQLLFQVGSVPSPPQL